MANRKRKTFKKVIGIIISSIISIIIATIAVSFKFGGFFAMCSIVAAYPLMILPILGVYSLFGFILVSGTIRIISEIEESKKRA